MERTTMSKEIDSLELKLAKAKDKGLNYQRYTIGLIIKTARVKRGLSQQELADRTDIKRSAIACIETGKRLVRVDHILPISKELKIPAISLIY